MRTQPQGKSPRRDRGPAGALKKSLGDLPQCRGRLIRLEDRQAIAQAVEEAHQAGARLAAACELVGISVRTLQRWQAGNGLEDGDRRPDAERPTPAHALSEAEKEEILRIANEPRFAAMPPSRIVPMLADEGQYVASESSFYRVLRANGQTTRQWPDHAPQTLRPPTTHVAIGPNEVWCWDMTFLPTTVAGRWFYLYLILDIYSRKVVAWDVHETDCSDHAARLVQRAALAEGVHSMSAKPVLHGDNGATLKATSVLAMLHWLGVAPSYSRPRVSDDNPYAEAFFRTVKYRPEFPAKGFASLSDARTWAAEFVRWYNHEHRHSGIRYVTPAQRHTGQDAAILSARHEVYTQAREANPRRWSGATRNWAPVGAVTLNPERDVVVQGQVRDDIALEMKVSS